MIRLFIFILLASHSILYGPKKEETVLKRPLTTATEKHLKRKKLNQHKFVERVLKRSGLRKMIHSKELNFSNKGLDELTDQELNIFFWNAKFLNPERVDFSSTEFGQLSPENWTSFCWLLGQWKNLTSLNLTANRLYHLNDDCWEKFLKVLEQSPNITELHLGSNGLKFFNSKIRHGNLNYSGNHHDDLIALGFEPDYYEEVWTRSS